MEIVWPVTEPKDKKFTVNVKDGWGKEVKECTMGKSLGTFMMHLL